MSITQRDQTQPNAISCSASMDESVLVVTVIINDINEALADILDDGSSSSVLTCTENDDGTLTLVATITPDSPLAGADSTYGHEIANINQG
jgi:hypothetical protein